MKTQVVLLRWAGIIHLLALLLASAVEVRAGAIRPFGGPGGIQQIAGTAGSLIREDDNSSPSTIPIGFCINFYGTPTDRVWVNNNGNITFNGPLGAYTPTAINGTLGIIAPFWADVDTRNGASGVTSYGQGTLVNTGERVFYVNWIGVGYFNTHADKLNSFQLVLIDRSVATGRQGNFDFEFNYDQITWETGDASGGSGGLGGSSARAGYGQDDGTASKVSFELTGSAINGAFLDSNGGGLIHRSLNSPQLGRYLFRVYDTHAVVSVSGLSTAIEGNTPAVFRISRTGPINSALTVNYEWSIPENFGDPISGSATIPVNQRTVDVTITPDNDTFYNITVRHICLTVQPNECNYILGNASACVSLIDDEEPVDDYINAYWSITTARDAVEGGNPGQVVITRVWKNGSYIFPANGSPAATTYLNKVYHTATAPDVGTVPTQVTVPENVLSVVVDIPAVNDTLTEPTEYFDLTITPVVSAHRIEPGLGSARMQIIDNDPAVTITATDPTASETTGDTGTFTVTRTGPATSVLMVNYTVSGTGVPNVDYVALSGTVIIPVGSLSATIIVTPINDGLFTPSTVTVTLASGSYNVGNPNVATVNLIGDSIYSLQIATGSSGDPSFTPTVALAIDESGLAGGYGVAGAIHYGMTWDTIEGGGIAGRISTSNPNCQNLYYPNNAYPWNSTVNSVSDGLAVGWIGYDASDVPTAATWQNGATPLGGCDYFGEFYSEVKCYRSDGDEGHLVGYSNNRAVARRGTIWGWDINPLPGLANSPYTVANGVNVYGEAVGVSKASGTNLKSPCYWAVSGILTVLPLLASSTEGEALAINDNGWIVGYCVISGNQRACLWKKSSQTYQATDLGVLGQSAYSVATAINNNGQIVGYSGYRACKWINNVAVDLNMRTTGNQGYILVRAYGINDGGQIVGTTSWGNEGSPPPMFPPNNTGRAFALTPQPINESATYVLDAPGTYWQSSYQALGLAMHRVPDATYGTLIGGSWFGESTLEADQWGPRTMFRSIGSGDDILPDTVCSGPPIEAILAIAGNYAVGYAGSQRNQTLFGCIWSVANGSLVQFPVWNSLSEVHGISPTKGYPGNPTSDYVVVGIFYGTSGYKAYYRVVSDSTYTELPGLSGSTDNRANAINEYLVIVGSSGSTSQKKACVWNRVNGVYQATQLPQIAGAISTESSEALGINRNGTIVGYGYRSGIKRPCIWNLYGSVYYAYELPGLTSNAPGQANDVGDRGEIVGTCNNSGGQSRGCVWLNGRLYDLNNKIGSWGANFPEENQDIIISTATRINSSGQFSGTVTANWCCPDAWRIYLMTPE